MNSIGRGLGLLGDILARGLGWFLGTKEEEPEPNYNAGLQRRKQYERMLRERLLLERVNIDDEDWFILD